jgi:hypothetical protein
VPKDFRKLRAVDVKNSPYQFWKDTEKKFWDGDSLILGDKILWHLQIHVLVIKILFFSTFRFVKVEREWL